MRLYFDRDFNHLCRVNFSARFTMLLPSIYFTFDFILRKRRISSSEFLDCARIWTSGHFPVGTNSIGFESKQRQKKHRWNKFCFFSSSTQGGAKGPGLFFILPCVDKIVRVDLRTTTFNVPPQEVPLLIICFRQRLS